jgi:hypothetical protein
MQFVTWLLFKFSAGLTAICTTNLEISFCEIQVCMIFFLSARQAWNKCVVLTPFELQCAVKLIRFVLLPVRAVCVVYLSVPSPVACSLHLTAHCFVLASHTFVPAAIFLYKSAPNCVEKLTFVTVVKHNPLSSMYSNHRCFYCGNFQKLKPRLRKGPLEVYFSKLHIKCQV